MLSYHALIVSSVIVHDELIFEHFFYFLIGAEESFECSGNTIALANYTSYRSPYGSRYSIGRVVACINGSFVTVCNNTVYPEYFARLACNRIDSYLSKLTTFCSLLLLLLLFLFLFYFYRLHYHSI